MHLWCRLGLHKWTYRDVCDLSDYITQAKCERNDCTRYATWLVVDRRGFRKLTVSSLETDNERRSMTVDPATKNRVFAMLKEQGAIKAVLSYNGGNDEGGVDDITLVLESVDEGGKNIEVDYPGQWDGGGELAELLEGPVSFKYGSWAGDFSAYGTLTWDVEAGTVVMDDYEQSGYDYNQERW